MPTLQEVRKAKYKTVKDFADAIGITPYQATSMLRGRDREVYWHHQDAVLAALGITSEAFLEAASKTDEVEEKKWRERHPPTKTDAQWEAELKTHADAQWAKMSEADKRRVHQDAIRLGIATQPERRSPLDILIDRAVGRE